MSILQAALRTRGYGLWADEPPARASFVDYLGLPAGLIGRGIGVALVVGYVAFVWVAKG